MFLQRHYAWPFTHYRSIHVTIPPCVKAINNSPILIRAPLLHLNRLLQLTVGGAEVVVAFHVGS